MTDLRPGFADPVAGTQGSFRAVLRALSRPGSLQRAGAGLDPPAPLEPAAAAVLLTLVDAGTGLWRAPAFAPAEPWITFHCEAPHADPTEAAFVLADALPALGALAAGTDEEPELGATVILQVRALGGGRALRLSGPGLREPALLHVDGLPGDFPARWAENRALYPRGLDLVLCCGTALAALPRSVTVEEG